VRRGSSLLLSRRASTASAGQLSAPDALGGDAAAPPPSALLELKCEAPGLRGSVHYYVACAEGERDALLRAFATAAAALNG
jgi:hypothetical protein